MSKRQLVYISGPITSGNRNVSFFQACEAQVRLMASGLYTCYNPMLSICLPGNNELDWETWIDCDLYWVSISDLVLRLPGASKGADVETEHARKLKIPVVGVDYFECLRGLYTHPVKHETKAKRFTY